MSRHRLHFASPLEPDTHVTLNGTQAHYLGHVLRVRPTQEVTLFDTKGAQYNALVVSVERKRVELHIGEELPAHTESSLQVTLIQSIIRGERMDFCVQKTTELGVGEIVPVFTQRSVVKIPPARQEKRTDHWQKIAISACEQSGRVKVPFVQSPQSLTDAITKAAQPNTVLLVLDPWANPLPLQKYTPPQGTRIVLCVGPEGGFAPEELDLLSASNAVSITCGPRILRSETAGVVAVAACQMLWGDW